MECTTDGCDKKVNAKGLCKLCYDRKRRIEKADHIKQKKREWYENNQDKVLAARKRNMTPEKRAADLERLKKWNEENPERHRIRVRNRRMKISQVPYDGWKDKDILERDNYTCQICFTPLGNDIHIDHIVALWAGGTHLSNNVRATHGRCNNRRTREEERNGV